MRKKSKFDDLCVKTFHLVPRLKRLGENEIKRFNQNKICCDSENDKNIAPLKIRILPMNEEPNSSNDSSLDSTSSSTRTLRTKRSAIGSMEDLWDETIFEDKTLNIPAINFESDKAAKKALKKARKEAKKFKKEQKKLENSIKIGDIVWTKNEDFWWPAKVIKSCEKWLEVILFGRTEQQPIKIFERSNLIKPFTERIKVNIIMNFTRSGTPILYKS